MSIHLSDNFFLDKSHHMTLSSHPKKAQKGQKRQEGKKAKKRSKRLRRPRHRPTSLTCFAFKGTTSDHSPIFQVMSFITTNKPCLAELPIDCRINIVSRIKVSKWLNCILPIYVLERNLHLGDKSFSLR